MASRSEWLKAGCLAGLLALLIDIASLGPVSADPISAWRQQVALRVSSQKQFPADATGQSGTAKIRFTIDRTGRLISAQLIESTGHPRLDAEAIAMIRRAEPFPAPPLQVDGDLLTFLAPIVFAPVPAEIGNNEAVAKGEEAVNAKIRGICRGC